MAWGALASSTQLTLTSSYSTVQKDAADWEFTLNPNELAQVIFEFNPEATPSENCDIIISRTADGSLYESDGEALRYIMSYSNSEADDPAVRSVELVGVYGFKVRARTRDTDDTAGGDDTASTLDVDVRLDGVSA